MPIFITQGRFTRVAIQGMIAKPDNRRDAVAKLVESVGGKLLAYYVTLGSYDFLLITEGPSEISTLAALAVAGAGPGVADLNTCVAVPIEGAMDAFAQAKSVMAGFRAAGTG